MIHLYLNIRIYVDDPTNSFCGGNPLSSIGIVIEVSRMFGNPSWNSCPESKSRRAKIGGIGMGNVIAALQSALTPGQLPSSVTKSSDSASVLQHFQPDLSLFAYIYTRKVTLFLVDNGGREQRG